MGIGYFRAHRISYINRAGERANVLQNRRTSQMKMTQMKMTQMKKTTPHLPRPLRVWSTCKPWRRRLPLAATTLQLRRYYVFSLYRKKQKKTNKQKKATRRDSNPAPQPRRSGRLTGWAVLYLLEGWGMFPHIGGAVPESWRLFSRERELLKLSNSFSKSRYLRELAIFL